MGLPKLNPNPRDGAVRLALRYTDEVSELRQPWPGYPDPEDGGSRAEHYEVSAGNQIWQEDELRFVGRQAQETSGATDAFITRPIGPYNMAHEF